MNDSLWDDRRFRAFVAERGGGFFAPELAEDEREEFVRQAELRVAPEAQRRLLRRVGSTVDARGVALVAFDVVDESSLDRRRTWLLACADPWAFLTDLVVRELVAAYDETVKADEEDDAQIAGIVAASSRRAIASGGAPGEG